MRSLSLVWRSSIPSILCLPAAVLSALGETDTPAGTTLRLAASADAVVAGGSFARTVADRDESLRLSNFVFDPLPPGVVIEPATPKAGDTLSVRLASPSVAFDGRPVRYSYLWHRRTGQQLSLVQSGEKNVLGQPVKAGERWRVFVVATASDGKNAMAWAETTVAGATPASVTEKSATSAFGQHLERRGYVAFEMASLAGRRVESAKLRLYCRPDVSWSRPTLDSAILVYLVPRSAAALRQEALTWDTQPLPALPREPLGRVDLPGRSVAETDPDWQAWSKAHQATWAERGKFASQFSNDPEHGLWRWREVDVTAAVAREAAAGAAHLAFCLALPPARVHAEATCSVRTRDYLDGRYAPTLVVVAR